MGGTNLAFRKTEPPCPKKHTTEVRLLGLQKSKTENHWQTAHDTRAAAEVAGVPNKKKTCCWFGVGGVYVFLLDYGLALCLLYKAKKKMRDKNYRNS